MFKQTATDLIAASPASIKKWIESFDTVLLDCDGVLWTGSKSIAGSLEVTQRFQELGKSVYFVTNAPIKTRTEIQEEAVSRHYNVSKDQIVSAAYETAKYLFDLKFTKKVYLVGSLGISKELTDFGIQYIESDKAGMKAEQLVGVVVNGVKLDEEVGAVVVSFDQNFSYCKLLEASNYLRDPECLFLATSSDEVYPTSNGTIVPAIGPIIRAIEVASGRTAKLLGKPESSICKSILANGKIVPERTLIVGDSAKYDILLGFNCGFQTLMVGSGVNSMNDVRSWQKSNIEEHNKLIPDAYIAKLGDLLPFLK